MNINNKTISVLVVGATGLIGSTVFRALSKSTDLTVFGTIRDSADKAYFSSEHACNLFSGFEASSNQKWLKIFKKIKPNVVINCLGVTKHLEGGGDPLVVIPINAYFPHYLNNICRNYGSRLIHISSDCVFSGNKGGYLESDSPDAGDYYGRSKLLGELTEGPSVTLRTSTIGHELKSTFGLLEWFLRQKGVCHGFKAAYFSGVPTFELARIIEKYVIPNPQIQGLYHVGGYKISKFNLLTQIADVYGKKIEIIPSSDYRIDRSLNSDRFYKTTGYKPPTWVELIKEMYLRK